MGPRTFSFLMSILNAIMDDDKFMIANLFGQLFDNASMPTVKIFKVNK